MWRPASAGESRSIDHFRCIECHVLLGGGLRIHDAAGDLATNITDLAFEIPNARLAGVGLDQGLKTSVRERKLPFGDPRFLELFLARPGSALAIFELLRSV